MCHCRAIANLPTSNNKSLISASVSKDIIGANLILSLTKFVVTANLSESVQSLDFPSCVCWKSSVTQ